MSALKSRRSNHELEERRGKITEQGFGNPSGALEEFEKEGFRNWFKRKNDFLRWGTLATEEIEASTVVLNQI